MPFELAHRALRCAITNLTGDSGVRKVARADAYRQAFVTVLRQTRPGDCPHPSDRLTVEVEVPGADPVLIYQPKYDLPALMD